MRRRDVGTVMVSICEYCYQLHLIDLIHSFLATPPVKLLIVDDSVAIMGSGNQDVQSWYHSQEINVLIDSPSFCKSLLSLIESNQNTFLYGEIDSSDAVWKGRDAEGRDDGDRVEGTYGPHAGVAGFAKATILTAMGKAK